MAEVVTAQFVGWTSCGFVTGKYYEIEVSAGRSGCLCVQEVRGTRLLPLFHAGKPEKKLACAGFAGNGK